MEKDGANRSQYLRSIFAAILLSAPALNAHDSLYNYIEVRSVDEKLARIEFTVHAAELVPGVDPNSADLLWIENLTDSQIEILLNDAKQFVFKSYLASMQSGSELAFPDAKSLRLLARDPDAPRPGCIIASLVVAHQSMPITLTYSAAAQKRLMLVSSKPGAFPKVSDIAPGENFEIISP